MSQRLRLELEEQGLYQEMESSRNQDVYVGRSGGVKAWSLQASCYMTKSKFGEIVMGDRKDCENHISESQHRADTGHSW